MIPPLTSRNQSQPPWPSQLGETVLILEGGVMFTSEPQPQNLCLLGLQWEGGIESSEYGWTWQRNMCILSVVRSTVDYFRMDSPPQVILHGEDGITSEHLSGSSQDKAVAPRAPLGGETPE